MPRRLPASTSVAHAIRDACSFRSASCATGRSQCDASESRVGRTLVVVDGRDSPEIAPPLRDVMTERLELARFVPEDADALVPVFAQPAVWQFPYGKGMDASWTAGFVARAIEHWDRFGFGLWVVRTRGEHRAIGYLGLAMPAFLCELVGAERMPAVEVGWRLDPSHWGQGYATEGATAALQEEFLTLQLTEVSSAPQHQSALSARGTANWDDL